MLDPVTAARINGFFFHLKTEKGLAENTIASYKVDLNDFFEYSAKKPAEIVHEDLVGYFNELRESGLDNNSIARRRSTLRSFFAFQLNEELPVQINPDDIPSVTYRQQLPDVLSVDEMLQLLDAIPLITSIDYRNKAIMELMYATGIRVSEALNLTESDIYWDQELIRVFGKGRKERHIPVVSQSLDYVRDYTLNHRTKLLKNHNVPNLFLNYLGKPLSRMGFWKVMQDLVLRAGIKKHVSPHTIRHSFATHLLEAGANLRIVQTLLGHVSINTTQIYTNIDLTHIKETHRLYHPRA